MLDRILDKLDELQSDISEIKHQTTKTNGRVTRLEEINKKKDQYFIWGLGLLSTCIGVIIWEYVKTSLINK